MSCSCFSSHTNSMTVADPNPAKHVNFNVGMVLGVEPLCYQTGHGYGMQNKDMLLVTASGSELLSDYAGLGTRQPILAFLMALFMLSLAGIPPTAGFVGKFSPRHRRHDDIGEQKVNFRPAGEHMFQLGSDLQRDILMVRPL